MAKYTVDMAASEPRGIEGVNDDAVLARVGKKAVLKV